MDIKKINWKNIDPKRLKYIVTAVLLIAALAVYMYCRGDEADGDVIQTEKRPAQELSVENEKDGSKTDHEKKNEYIYIDVSGAVNTPMVVCVPAGSRVFEAIDAAGGRTSEASVKNLNLASVCEDGQKIYVPTVDEAAAQPAQGQDGAGGAGTAAGARGTETYQGSSGTAPAAAPSPSGGKVNINTAGSEELQTLNGVGPATASKIIDYRNKNGSFRSPDELTSVSGIGEKTYEKLKDHICV